MRSKINKLLNKSQINKNGFVGAIDKYGNLINKNPLPNYLQMMISIILLALFAYLSVILFSFFISAIGFIILSLISLQIFRMITSEFKSTINLRIKSQALIGFFTMVLLFLISIPLLTSFVIVKTISNSFKSKSVK